LDKISVCRLAECRAQSLVSSNEITETPLDVCEIGCLWQLQNQG
jgi:hypothetical protein